jgi:hypothetical protein
MKHAKLSPADKVMYTDLTKLAGLSKEEDVVKEKPPVAVQKEREQEGEQMMEVTTTGRQKFGDTRNMKMFDIKNPLLDEYCQ